MIDIRSSVVDNKNTKIFRKKIELWKSNTELRKKH